MRKVVSGLFITLDGVTEAPDQWQFDNFDEDMDVAMGEQIGSMDTVLLGRVTYEEWAPYWPTASHEPFASFINNVPKVVFSTTLKQVDWKHARLATGTLAEQVGVLKQQPGKNIGITGSPGLVGSLIENDLLDELILTVHPVVAGHGKRLFKEGGHLKRMKLIDSKITRTGVAMLTYQLNLQNRPDAPTEATRPFLC